MTVRDFNGEKIEVGSRVVFGSPSTPEERAFQTGEVISISESDMTFREGEYGEDVPTGYEIEVIVKFSDDTTEKVKGRDVSVRGWETYDDDETYEVEEIEIVKEEKGS